MIVVPFKAEHAFAFQPQKSQLTFDHQITEQHAAYLETTLGFTGIVGEKVVACSGVVPYWGDRGVAWALLAEDSGPHFTAIHKAVFQFLETTHFKRVEAYVDLDFKPAHRWMKMLGFEVETPVAKRVLPSGKDGAVYVRLK